MKKTNKKAIIMYISIILFVFNMSISFAFWASQINIGSNMSTGSISVGSWPFIPNGFLGVSQNGDEGDNYITLDEVQATGNYILMSHIDWNQNTFQSIGGSDVFSGVFIGNGYAISNIMITNNTSPYVGLFARNNGTISNLSLTDITIDLTTNQDVYVGGIAGINTGTIEQSFSTGTIIVSSSKTTSSNNQTLVNNLYVGGVSGSNAGSIVDSYANINLTAITSILAGNPRSNVTANTYAGGLVGLNSTAGIERSYALGVVNATSTATRTQGNSTTYAYVYAGGLIGDNTHASGFNHSFAVGNVNPTVSANTGSSRFSGGLVGRTITLSGLLVNYRPLSGQTVGGTPNSIGLTTDISNFQSETWVPTTLQWSTDIWRFELSNYPKLIKNHN